MICSADSLLNLGRCVSVCFIFRLFPILTCNRSVKCLSSGFFMIRSLSELLCVPLLVVRDPDQCDYHRMRWKESQFLNKRRFLRILRRNVRKGNEVYQVHLQKPSPRDHDYHLRPTNPRLHHFSTLVRDCKKSQGVRYPISGRTKSGPQHRQRCLQSRLQLPSSLFR